MSKTIGPKEQALLPYLEHLSDPDEGARNASHTHWAELAKPLGSLGILEEDLERIAALTGSAEVSLDKRAVLVLCADNGVVAQGVTQTDSSVTGIVADELAGRRTSVCRMADCARCEVIPVDIGIRDYRGNAGVLDRKVKNGTDDISEGPAMTREQAAEAVLTGIRLVKEQKEAGYDILCTGEMGIGNTTTSSAILSVLLGLDPASVTGPGAGLSKEGVQRKIEVIRKAIRVNDPDPEDVLDILSKVGGLDIAGLCGIFLGGAVYRVPVLMDGFISNVAALCAIRLAPRAKKAVLASHTSTEPGVVAAMEAIGLPPVISAGMHLGEGTGAVAALPLLDMALACYSDAYTFEEGGIEPYQPC